MCFVVMKRPWPESVQSCVPGGPAAFAEETLNLGRPAPPTKGGPFLSPACRKSGPTCRPWLCHVLKPSVACAHILEPSMAHVPWPVSHDPWPMFHGP